MAPVAIVSDTCHYLPRELVAAHGIHEVVLPCVSYNTDRKLDKAPGYAIREFRPAWVRVDVFEDKRVLNYKPVGADVAATKELKLA